MIWWNVTDLLDANTFSQYDMEANSMNSAKFELAVQI